MLSVHFNIVCESLESYVLNALFKLLFHAIAFYDTHELSIEYYLYEIK